MSAPTKSELIVPPGQTPAAAGTLDQTPLLHLYVYLLDKSLTGTTVLAPPSGPTVGLFVEDGSPTRSLMRDGSVAFDRASMERALVDLCLLPADTRYAFYPRHDFFAAQTPGTRIEPLAAIMSAARACVGTTFASATLRKVMKASSITVASNASPERFRLSPEERALIERIRKQALTLTDLISTSGVPEQIVRGVIYGLTITRHLDFGVAARPPVGVDVLPQQAKPIPPAASSNPGTGSGTTATIGIAKSGQTGTPQIAKSGQTGMGLQDQAVQRPKPKPDPEPFAMRPRLNSELELIEPPPSSKMPVSYRMLETVATDKRRAEIEAKLVRIPNENHFEILGIKEDASVLEIRDAYFGMARIFHPDRLTDLPDLRAKAQTAFSRISAAYNELSDDKKRAAYTAKLKAELDKSDAKAVANATNTAGQATIGRAVNAAFEAQKAELFLKKNEFPAAEMHAKMAALADPDQPSYTALLVWIQAQQRVVPPIEDGKMSPIFDDLVATLDQILRKEPTFERALFYRAVLLQRTGQTDRAFKDFSKALELNPRNIDAAREVRLYKLRHKDKTEEPPPNNSGGGIFGKLFKR